MSSLRTSRLAGVLLIVALLLVWELLTATKVINSPSLPRVSSIFADWGRFVTSGEMVRQLIPSLARIAVGYTAAAIVGVTIGLLMGYFRLAYVLLEPLTELLRPIPSPAYIPLAILFLGLGEEMKLFVVFFACFFPILLNTYSGVVGIDPVQINTGRTFGLSRPEILRKIILYSALPSIFTGLRISLGVALIVVVVAEMIASNVGIGYFILNAQRFFNVTDMFAGIFTLAILGYGLNWAFLSLERRLLRWRVRSDTQ
jgi:ABC-type nitrate/sulfonate/bicarbonate transport system permease component